VTISTIFKRLNAKFSPSLNVTEQHTLVPGLFCKILQGKGKKTSIHGQNDFQ